MPAFRNRILGATFATMATLTAPIQASAEQDNTPMQLATATTTNEVDYSEANSKYVHNFQTMTFEDALEASKGGVVLHIGEGFALSIADNLEDNLLKDYDAQVVLGGTKNRMQVMINGTAGSLLYDSGQAFTHVLEKVAAAAPVLGLSTKRVQVSQSQEAVPSFN